MAKGGDFIEMDDLGGEGQEGQKEKDADADFEYDDNYDEWDENSVFDHQDELESRLKLLKPNQKEQREDISNKLEKLKKVNAAINFYRFMANSGYFEPNIIRSEIFDVEETGIYVNEVRLTDKRDNKKFVSEQTIRKNFKEIYPRGDFNQFLREDLHLLTETQHQLRDLEGYIDTAVEKHLTPRTRITTNNAIHDALERVFYDNSVDAKSQTDGLNYRELVALDKKLQTINGAYKLNLAELGKLYARYDIKRAAPRAVERDSDAIDLHREVEDIEDKIQAALDLKSNLQLDMSNQFAQIRETIHKMLDSDTSLREKIRILFREQGVTVVSILAAFSLAIGTIVASIIAAVRGAVVATAPTPTAPTPTPTPIPPNPGGNLKDWVSNHLKNLANLLKKIGGKLLAALPGILGGIASWLFNLLSKTVGWLAEHVWALLIGVGTLILVYMQKN